MAGVGLARQTIEPPTMTEESASIEEPSSNADADGLADASSVIERLTSTGKKGKKKKKRQSQISAKLDDDSSTPSPCVEISSPPKAVESTVNAEAEFAVPKRGKKNKKRQQTFSWDLASDANPQQPDQEPNLPSEGQGTIEPEPEPGIAGDKASVFPGDDRSVPMEVTEESSNAPRQETELGSGPGVSVIGKSSEAVFLESPAAEVTSFDKNEPILPGKMSKRDKRLKKMQQSMLDDTTQLGYAEASTNVDVSLDEAPERANFGPKVAKKTPGAGVADESRAAEDLAVAAVSAVGPGASDKETDQPVGTSEQQSEAVPDAEWGGFSLKRSKKNKNKRKAKDVEPTKPQEPETATPPGPERVDPVMEQAREPLPEGIELAGENLSKEPESVLCTYVGATDDAGFPLVKTASEGLGKEALDLDQAPVPESEELGEARPLEGGTLPKSSTIPVEPVPVLVADGGAHGETVLPLEKAANAEADKEAVQPDPSIDLEAPVQAEVPPARTTAENPEDAVPDLIRNPTVDPEASVQELPSGSVAPKETVAAVLEPVSGTDRKACDESEAPSSEMAEKATETEHATGQLTPFPQLEVSSQAASPCVVAEERKVFMEVGGDLGQPTTETIGKVDTVCIEGRCLHLVPSRRIEC